MTTTYVSAQSLISELISKKDQIIDRAASIVYDVVSSKKGYAANDIGNLIKDFSEEEQVKILEKVIILLATNSSNIKQKPKFGIFD